MKSDRKIRFPEFTSAISQYAVAFLIIAFVVFICRPLADEEGYHIVSFILLFAVTIMAAFLGIGPVLFASTVSALVWNYFFIPPHYTLRIAGIQDKLMFGSFFFVALLNGILTNRIRQQERLAREREERTRAIFELTQDLTSTGSIREVLCISLKNIKKYFRVSVLYVFRQTDSGIEIMKAPKNEGGKPGYDLKAVEWVFIKSKKAGKYSDIFTDSDITYFPVTGNRQNRNVIAVDFNTRLPAEKELFWTSYLVQISNALEREFLSELALKARLLDETDRLYKTLFTLISHEFRIPLATIMGAADALLLSGTSDKNVNDLHQEIFKASTRLNHLIENLLSMSRLESGKISVRPDWCDINDLLNSATRTLKQELETHNFIAGISTDVPLLRLDFGLIEQVIYNLLLNSARHNQSGTEIRFSADYLDGNLVMIVEDNGTGFPPEILEKVFDKFFRADNSKTGGLGLGLSIVKGIVEAHKGTVKVENIKTGGARFIVKIPSELPRITHLETD